MGWLMGGLIVVLIVGFAGVCHGLGQIAKQLYQLNVMLAAHIRTFP